MKFRLPGLALATSVALMLLVLPVVAQDTSGATTSTAAATGSTAAPTSATAPSSLTYELDWRSKDDSSARRIARERDVEVWSLALLGPAAMLFIVIVLGITITVRSLREESRYQRSLYRYRRSSPMSRASRQANRD